jgi:hypothetical protein
LYPEQLKNVLVRFLVVKLTYSGLNPKFDIDFHSLNHLFVTVGRRQFVHAARMAHRAANQLVVSSYASRCRTALASPAPPIFFLMDL